MHGSSLSSSRAPHRIRGEVVERLCMDIPPTPKPPTDPKVRRLTAVFSPANIDSMHLGRRLAHRPPEPAPIRLRSTPPSAPHRLRLLGAWLEAGQTPVASVHGRPAAAKALLNRELPRCVASLSGSLPAPQSPYGRVRVSRIDALARATSSLSSLSGTVPFRRSGGPGSCSRPFRCRTPCFTACDASCQRPSTG